MGPERTFLHADPHLPFLSFISTQLSNKRVVTTDTVTSIATTTIVATMTFTNFLKFSSFTLLSLTLLHRFLPSLPLLSSLSHRHHLLLLLSFLSCTLLYLYLYARRRPLPVFLFDYSCYLPEPERRSSLEVCEYYGFRCPRLSHSTADFMRAIFLKSGLGDETYAPPYIFQEDYDAKFRYAVQEAEEGMFDAVSSLLSKTSIPTSAISVLIVACSMFSPVPSLSSFIVNHFNFDPSIKTYNLSGMGCSGGTMCCDLAAKILCSKPGYALIVVTENMSLNWYFGENRQMLVTNCIFRVGTAAMLLTSDPTRRCSAKMELVRALRTHHGAEDAAYNAAVQMEDEDGSVGMSLSKDLVRVAGAELRRHISTLAPHVLPASELLRYAWNVVRSYAAGDHKTVHVPDFTKAFEHICIHTGGKAVINAVGKLMKFSAEVTEPARMCLHRFGNTSSSLVFYELAYFEAKGRIKKGDRVWMLAFGTGFKACSLVWKALRDSGMDSDNPWQECIHRYPVK
ncbi:3-ketoacyl-CoA synthase 13-like [Ananas comosus]|uniref:3-ketoacyl-CoA synthase n=1 Tax=Ananas comosus TaxID=4615 RepID=A0A199VKE1_ANACO|nr:3-ketoacyl-CoA synthase 13-like [Ananas comosus]OAY77478.1 3-ketoacyl-CoA synthase 1 [Ananas comosus]